MIPDEVDSIELRKQWDNKDQFVEYEYRRIYKLSMVPSNLIGRVFVELIHIPSIKLCLLWKTGLILSYTLNSCPCSSYPCEQRAFIKFHSEGGHKIEILVRCCHVSHRLLRMISETIYNLVEDLKLTNCITRLVPCTHCLKNKFSNIFNFKYEECIDKVAHGKQIVYCSNIKSQTRRTLITTIAPDIIFASIPKIRSSQLQIVKLLGQGGFGVVYKAIYTKSSQTEINVAIKQPHGNIEDDPSNENNNNSNNIDPQQQQQQTKYDANLYDEFMKEVQIMRELRHPNIVELIGVAFHPLRMILEFVEKGDLFDLLHDHDKVLPWKLRLLIAWDIAKGMRALQLHSPPIIHRDLHAHNIFISSLSTKSSKQRAKIADFGLARGVVRAASFALSDIWLAPEILNAEPYDSQSDVYSFAICCWQIATRKNPFESSSNIPFLRDAIVNNNLRPDYELLKQSEAPEEFINLIIKCWDRIPQNRPTFSKIVDKLRKIIGLKKVPYDFGDVLRGSLAGLGAKGVSPVSTNFINVLRDHSNSKNLLNSTFNVNSIIGDSVTITCGIKIDNYIWLGTARGDIITMDIFTVCFSFFFFFIFFF